ncbi:MULTISPECIES: cryptochrome/photolyase family protein [unclassified Caulobacter]|uniref:cryptochrome/photolyase family protein n=1 Tax=unclassified Caulobacter TaxID=2648921 RepID=UPI000D3BB3B6|nr:MULTISPECIES: cryptochrome/photolyase family protein [unclassified Caulobacter]PTS81940.1 cryptochrome/photolyase family protein [Caulobacter sp. HMWF009]PTT11330.1 cryptochrome/photolyase family protein [Caulobacter sp. HMWF025]
MNRGQGALRLVLGDQLSDSLSALAGLDAANDLVLMTESVAEATAWKHHKQKLVLVWSAMRQFADRLRARGIQVRYVTLDDPANTGSISGEIRRALDEAGLGRVIRTACGKWSLEAHLLALADTLSVPVETREDDRFLCSRQEFAAWAEGRKELRMEYFYREMRRKTGLLMDGDKPAGGQWNYDAENRRKLPAGVRPPQRLRTPPNPVTQAVMARVAAGFEDHFGTADGFGWPTNPDEAAAVLDHFFDDMLAGFGDWQDAMSWGRPFLWHSLISPALNIGLLDPLAICRRAEAAWREGRAPLNAVEGFIRQILGWREFVRGVYWLKMPEYGQRNALDAQGKLPAFYWTGQTDMACVADAVTAVRDHAYAHHIQRLMVTGNLAMLLGVHPDAVDDWYMVVFADAYEWVEMPNTRGMATFADGGIVGSKPYAASGAYIDRMSDYCKGCRYDVKDRLGASACPFNALYWDFIDRHERQLAGLGRMMMPLKTLSKMPEAERVAFRAKAAATRRAMGV